MKRFIIIGDSHCRTYRRAADDAGRSDIGGGSFLGARQLHHDFFVTTSDDITFTGRAADNFKLYSERFGIPSLADCPKRSLVVSMGLAAAPFYGHPDWRRRCSFAPERRISRMIVSEAVIRQIIEDLQRPVLAFYDWLHRKELIFAAVASARPQRRNIVVAEFGVEKVLRLVQLYEEPVRQKLKALGHPIVDVADTTDHDGLLREEYWGHNWSHANMAYGRLVIEQLDRIASQAREPAHALA